MFKPKYELTGKLIANLGRIERFYGRLESLRLPSKIELNLERDNLIKSSYISNSIEGNPLSLPEVTSLLLDGRAPANHSEKEVRNYFDILKSLKVYQSGIFSLELVLEIHKKLLTGVNEKIAGKLRDKEVIVGGYHKKGEKIILQVKHRPPFHTQAEIRKALRRLFNWFNGDKKTPAALKAGIFHHHFVYLYPFTDGNGRTCRLLTALAFLQADYLINRYFVLDDWYDIDRALYSDKLHSADFGDKTEWLEYFSDGIKYSLQAAVARVKTAINKLGAEERPTAKEREVLEIFGEYQEMTSQDLAQKLAISRQQAHNLLSSLVNKGLADKKGRTKSTYYFLKQ